MVSRRQVLIDGSAAVIVSSGMERFVTQSHAAVNPANLSDHADQRGLFYGCAVELESLRDAAMAEAVRQECGIIVPSWEAKRDIVEPAPREYNFAPIDEIMKFAKTNKLLFRGHVLVWHRANPPWLLRELIERPSEDLLTDYVSTVVRRYRRRVHSWDVVNEAVELNDGRPDGLRRTPFLEAFGPRYIDLAFRAARAADPHALLMYNEYDIEYADNDDRRAAVLALLSGLVSRKVPVDALAIQGHLRAYRKTFDASVFRRFLSDVAGLGLRIIVSELDVIDRGGSKAIKDRDAAVATMTTELLDIALEQPNTIGVLTWGLSDRYTWLTDDDLGMWPDGQPSRVLPLDVDLARKPMWHAMAAAFDRAAKRPRRV